MEPIYNKLLIVDLLRSFGKNPESLAIILTYYSMPKEECLKFLKENIQNALDEVNSEAANVLIDIHRMVSKTKDEDYEFIQKWILHKIENKKKIILKN